MAKEQEIIKDINGTQICVGDKVALLETSYGGKTRYILETGKVVKINSKSFKYVLWRHRDRPTPEYPPNRLHPSTTALVIDGEFVRNGKIIGHE